MWEIYEHRRLVRKLDSIPVDVLKRYEEWKDIVRLSGPQGLRQMKGLCDESLSGKWNRHRSSRLNLQYRVIYRIEEDKVFVQVVRYAP